MQQYNNILSQILATGSVQSNRTGTDAIHIPAAMMQFDMADGFPAVTTKQLFYKKGFAEQIGFLRGYNTVEQFKSLGCDWWEADANRNSQWLASPHRKGEGDLGRIYGMQWRHWAGIGQYNEDYEIDQFAKVLETIRTNPTNRRIVMNAWRPDEFDQMALPPCHVLYQFVVDVSKAEIHMSMYQRSCDMFLGVPMNIANSALLLHLVAAATGYTPRLFTHFMTDPHIYVNHVDQVHTQLERKPYPLPQLQIKYDLYGMSADDVAAVRPEWLILNNYTHHPAIKGEMSTG